jgi:hypothetical protein
MYPTEGFVMATVRAISEGGPWQPLRADSTNGLSFLFVFYKANVPRFFVSTAPRFGAIVFP